MTTATLSLDDPRAGAGRLPFWAAATMAVMSGSLLALSYSLHPLWWAAWLAPAPVLAAAVAGPADRNRVLGALAGLVAGASTLSYYIEVTGWPVTLVILAAHMIYWSSAISLSASAAARRPAIIAVFALPLFTAGLEALVIAVSPHGSAGSLAYSQMDALAVIQIAALGGLPAIVFVVLSGASLAGLVAGRLMGAALPWRELGRAGLAVAMLVGATLLFGVYRLAAAESDATKISVVLIATDRFAREPEVWSDVWSVYGPAVAANVQPGGIVVLPEKLALLSTEAAQAAKLELAALAQSRHATIVTGLEVRDATGRFANRAVVAGPDGTVESYDKQHLVPLLEARDTPGHTLLVSHYAGVRAGVAICKDMHFPTLGRDYGRAGAQLMLVPAWDFVRDAWLSDRLTALRGVEGGFAIARATRGGISSVSDRYGRIVAEAQSTAAVNVVRAEVSLQASISPTLYDIVGDAFGWLCLVGAAVLVAGLRLRRQQGPRQTLTPR